MMMPNLDGVGVLRCLTECGQYVPVVAMSASTEWLGKAKQAGATATLKKPFDLDDLLKDCRAEIVVLVERILVARGRYDDLLRTSAEFRDLAAGSILAREEAKT